MIRFDSKHSWSIFNQNYYENAMANNCKQCLNTHYQPHCHPLPKSLWLCSSVFCGPPHQSRCIWLAAEAANPKSSKLRATGLCEGTSLVIVDFYLQRIGNAENVAIWWRHHALVNPYSVLKFGQWWHQSIIWTIVDMTSTNAWAFPWVILETLIQWNLSVTTTSMIKFITCDLFSNVFQWRLNVLIYAY